MPESTGAQVPDADQVRPKATFRGARGRSEGYLDEMKSMTESIKGFLKKADKVRSPSREPGRHRKGMFGRVSSLLPFAEPKLCTAERSIVETAQAYCVVISSLFVPQEWRYHPEQVLWIQCASNMFKLLFWAHRQKFCAVSKIQSLFYRFALS